MGKLNFLETRKSVSGDSFTHCYHPPVTIGAFSLAFLLCPLYP